MKPARTVFLTGATGFIGARVARALAERGDAVRCLVRDPTRAGALADLGATLFEGDVTNRAVMDRGLEGADAAIHLAAVYDIGVVDEKAMTRSNVEGTAVFVAAVTDAKTPRCIYVSTTVALGPVGEGIGDESTRNHGPFNSAYERTKTTAHMIATDAQQRGSRLMIVCPGYVYGPGDNGPGGRFLIDIARKRVPGLLMNPAWFSFVHVDDVVSGIIAALERGEPGATYVLSGEAASINAFAKRAAAAVGVRPPLLRFPAPLARITGILLDRVSRISGWVFPITRENVDTANGHRWLHSHMKATQELGWAPRPLAEGLGETMRWVKLQARR